MDDVAKFSSGDRADLFVAVAGELGLTAEIIEKDFWVCWTLKRLFALKDPPAGLLFKGGTSLSKAYNAIQRFSEDVDLSFDRAALGFSGETDPLNAESGKKRKASLDDLSEKCKELVTGPVIELLRSEFEVSLGPVHRASWSVNIADDADDGQTLLFEYPRARATGPRKTAGYIQDVVRLEFGARADQWPAVEKSIRSYAAETRPQLFKDPTCTVKVLAGERTFWEKATILHMWHHIKERPLPPRQSRHYYDLVSLYGHEIGKAALQDLSLLDAVVNHKSVFFPSGWANYETAKPGTLRLVPKDERLRELENDYDKMRTEMFFGDPPSFVKLLAKLRQLESDINDP